MGEPRPLAMFPLQRVLFPHGELPLHVFEPRYRTLMDDSLAGEREFGVVLIAQGSEVGGGDRRFGVGTLAHITAASRFADGRWALVVTGRQRIAVSRWLEDAPYPRAEVTDLAEEDGAAEAELLDRAAVAVRRVRTLLSELGRPAPVLPEALEDTDAGARLWRLCAVAPLTALDGQRLLEAPGPAARVARLVELAEARAEDLAALLGAGGGAPPGPLPPTDRD
ncbi:MAG TPA: LON peptidase substrate-binding domain-containing protein [Acidimicrobiales bacterium]|nr:LON peptidase substrate-binding domain-containing protein [Acidimicrobiales bacterium]